MHLPRATEPLRSSLSLVLQGAFSTLACHKASLRALEHAGTRRLAAETMSALQRLTLNDYVQCRDDSREEVNGVFL
jgi:hypothetical protein